MFRYTIASLYLNNIQWSIVALFYNSRLKLFTIPVIGNYYKINIELIDLKLDNVKNEMKCNYKEEINHLDNTIESSESLIESSESLIEGSYIEFY